MSFFLDQFPVELFHMIFTYLWTHEILHLFGNINAYINSILSNYKNYMINFESIRKSDFDLICRYMRPEQVISLILSDKIDTPNQSQLFRSLFSIKQFTHLRALKLIELDDDGESFFSEWSKIQHLVSLEIDVKNKLPFIENSPPLQRLIINILEGVQFDLDPLIAFIRYEQLRHLSLSNCSCAQLQHIFHRAVRLTSLKISFIFLDPNEIVILANFHREQTRIRPLVSLSLFIQSYADTVMRVHIERFLAPLQHLRQLELVISSGAEHSFADGYQWEIFIIKHLSKLVTFNFKFFSWNNDENTLEPFHRSFWLDKHWYVACEPGDSFLFTVPHFAQSSINHSFTTISSACTTLPIEKHFILYDRVTQLKFDSNQSEIPYRYNHVKKLILDNRYIDENVLDLSKVQAFIVNTSRWSLYKILRLIKKKMPSVNSLTLNCEYTDKRYRHLPNISLEQVRILKLPQYGQSSNDNLLNWSLFFPSVERLIVSINSKKQIPSLIDQFEHMVSAYFYVDPCQIDINKPIHMTRQWLKKHTDRLRGRNTDNFICQINERFYFTLCLWIGENDECDQEVQTIRTGQRWYQCFA